MKQLMTCLVGEHRLAVDVRFVREIIRQPRITRVPCGPPHIAGLINLRGRVLTVFDMCQCLASGSTHEDGNGYILIMRASGEVVHNVAIDAIPTVKFEQAGLQVAGIGEIASIEESALVPPPANLPLGKLPFVPALAELEGRLHGVLDVGLLYEWAGIGR